MRIGARVLAGVVAVGGAGALVLGAAALPSPAAATSGTDVTPVPVDQLRVCPGPLIQLGDDQAATTMTSFGSPDVTAGTPGGAGATSAAITRGDVASAAHS